MIHSAPMAQRLSRSWRSGTYGNGCVRKRTSDFVRLSGCALCVITLLRRVHGKLCAKGGCIQKVLTMAGSVQQMAERCFRAGATLRPHFDVPPHEALPGAFRALHSSSVAHEIRCLV
jgi:hypothetical protein